MSQCVLLTGFHCFQDLYSAAPVALAPFLGNPVLLATFGIDRSAPFLEQVIASQQQEVILLDTHLSSCYSSDKLHHRRHHWTRSPSWCSCSNLRRGCAACCHSCRLSQKSCRPRPSSGSSSSSKRAAGILPQASWGCKQCRLAMQILFRLTGALVKLVLHNCIEIQQVPDAVSAGSWSRC